MKSYEILREGDMVKIFDKFFDVSMEFTIEEAEDLLVKIENLLEDKVRKILHDRKEPYFGGSDDS